MNWKKIILLSCVLQCVFAVSTATAQMRGHGPSTARMPMRPAPMLGSTGRMSMQRAPMLNSASGFRRFHRFNDGDFDRDDRFRRFHRFNDGDFDRDDRFHRFHRFNDGDFDRDDRFRRFRRFNEIIIFDDFGFPFFPFPPFSPFPPF